MTANGESGRVESIRLPDGWSARVRIGARIGDQAPAGLEAWRRFLTQLVTGPEALPGYAVLKSSRGSDVFRATLTTGDRPITVVAKQSRLHSLRRRLSAMTQGTREARNFRKSLSLLAAGFDTAIPLALLERRRPKRESWLITEFLPDVFDLDRIARDMIVTLDPRARLRVKKDIIGAIVEVLLALEDHALTHRDFKASNLLLRRWNHKDAGPSVFMVDLDGIHRTRMKTRRSRWRPVIRLVASLSHCSCVTRSDLVRLLRSYLAGQGARPDAWRAHFRWVADQAVTYERSSQRRKVKKLDGR